MDNNVLGLLKLRIKRGINLAIRDSNSSDPYVVVNIGHEQKLKTRVVKNNCNPEWNEELTLSIRDVRVPICLTVFDKDTFFVDDKMGDAEIDLKPYTQCVKMKLDTLPNGCAIKRVQANRTNCLAEESSCIWKNGKVLQEMILRLRNVESGELVVEIEWVDVPGCKGLLGAQM
ncbi:putative C2 domain-containing protein [Medicago truncatula]|uniref:Calcium-dependent lipid-binding (CaLB domain) family protein n=1 Tax=Medicago truncatula TaxID=3880 RepID=G7I9Z6_MEDTR|nr:protein C2-DOMAIN ABA-RELATED 9 isoform X2 [Medicago truncatula]AES59907.1 calcium-dependent lipid-binding (CaLB domain) family protein [Medicago truncatula]RHN78002.1 putative C2 domain-containing protein [Medicago truncatula]